MINAEFPEKLSFLFQPMRYKVARGGRGSGKSWSFARALLIQAAASPLLVLCTREVQKSIKDSVHKLLNDQIQALGLGSFYDVLETEIRGRNGSKFIFAGLSGQTIESIKSLEGCDRVWCEEAQAITKRSWDVLTPTIRREGSEIWISYNPELESDETHQRFTINPPDDCVSVLVNYHDNPFFPDVLEKERLRCLKNDPQSYPNIWDGKCKPAVEGAIYYAELERMQLDEQICRVPYDPMLRVHIILDLGWNDLMTASFVQVLRSEVRIIEYEESDHTTLDQLSSDWKAKRLNWGKVWLPHDGFNRDFKTGKSTEEILKGLGWDVANRKEITEVSVEEGIRLARMMLGRTFIDSKKAAALVERLKRYRRQINQTTQEAGAPLHDEASHGADNVRYIAVNVSNMTNDDGGEQYDEDDQPNPTRSQYGGY
jgi:phage terminase large subunit